MSFYSDVVLDKSGNVVPGALITVTNTGGAVPTLYLDYTQRVVQSQPLIANSRGEYQFDCAAGRYIVTASTSGVVNTKVIELPSATPILSPQDFSAEADGSSHKLQDGFSTLAAAQAVYPFVTSLTQELDWAATQAACNASLRVKIPEGNYIWSDPVALRPAAQILGHGQSQSLSGVIPSSSNIENTRIFQTGAGPAFTTVLSPLSTAFNGRIHISDLTVQGRYNATNFGTYGIYCLGSQAISLTRVRADFFKNSGIYIAAAVDNVLDNCSANYCEDNGVFLDNQTDGNGATYNAYVTKILGGIYYQNKNTNIKLEASTIRVSIQGTDIESASVFYGAGLGYGIWIRYDSASVEIADTWFEDNKCHVVVGDTAATPSLTNVPQNTKIRDNYFFSLHAGGLYALMFNTGKGHEINNCSFPTAGAASTIFVNHFSDNPRIINSGKLKIVDGNSNVVTYGSEAFDDQNPYHALGAYLTVTNGSIAQDEIAGPAGQAIPVFKITPSGAGQVVLNMPEVPYTQLQKRCTIGCYMRTDYATPQRFSWLLASTTIGRLYTDSNLVNDTFDVTQQWQWFSIGRSIDSADTGNQQLRLYVTVADATPFYICALPWMSGIVDHPYKLVTNIVPDNAIQVLANSATPDVLGVTKASTGGTTTITNFLYGATGQPLELYADHSLTITNGTNIFLSGNANFNMVAKDVLTVVRRADGFWYEVNRSHNS